MDRGLSRAEGLARAPSPPRYLGGNQRQVCPGSGMVRPPNAGSRRGPEADRDDSYVTAICKSRMTVVFGPIGPGWDFARGGFPRPAGGERDRVGGMPPPVFRKNRRISMII
jgi:hypothetical protein